MTEEEKAKLRMVNVETYGPKTKWSYMTALKGMQQYNEKIVEIAHEREVNLIDLDKALPKTTEYFNDDVHYTEKAYDLIANFIANKIIEHKMIDFKLNKKN
jgi:lysophospholipase L1-like esterase